MSLKYEPASCESCLRGRAGSSSVIKIMNVRENTVRIFEETPDLSTQGPSRVSQTEVNSSLEVAGGKMAGGPRSWRSERRGCGGGYCRRHPPEPWFRNQGSGFRVQGSGFRVQGSGFRVYGSGFRVQGLGVGDRRY